MKCDDIADLMSAWMDNELDSEEHHSVTQHLEHCQSCQTHLEREKYFRSLLKAKVKPQPVPHVLKQRISTSLAEEAARLNLAGENVSLLERLKAWFSQQPMPAYVLAGVFVFVLCLVVAVPLLRPASATSEQWLTAAAVQCHQQNTHPMAGFDYTEGDMTAIVQKVNTSNKRDFALAMPSIDTMKNEIYGCRFCHLKDKPSVYFAFKHKGHFVSLEVASIKDVDLPIQLKGAYYRAQVNNYNLVAWEKNGLVYVMTSDLNESDMMDGINVNRTAMKSSESPLANI